VQTIKGSKRNQLAVDATTGALIANPESRYEPHTSVQPGPRLAP
jgi:hypothetical protein